MENILHNLEDLQTRKWPKNPIFPWIAVSVIIYHVKVLEVELIKVSEVQCFDYLTKLTASQSFLKSAHSKAKIGHCGESVQLGITLLMILAKMK